MAKQFLARVLAETGLELEIVDRQTEARLAVSGCGTLVTRETDAVVLFDIGGGSSEIALIDVSQSPFAASGRAYHGLDFPSRRRCHAGRTLSADATSRRKASTPWFRPCHRAAVRNLPSVSVSASSPQAPRFHLLGTSGTVTTLAGIHLGLDRYDRRRVDGMWMGCRRSDTDDQAVFCHGILTRGLPILVLVPTEPIWYWQAVLFSMRYAKYGPAKNYLLPIVVCVKAF
jgi:exopolyphosphatase/guanosine-5'-triphosphate,3'-diphosphate pyrophosphatase